MVISVKWRLVLPRSLSGAPARFEALLTVGACADRICVKSGPRCGVDEDKVLLRFLRRGDSTPCRSLHRFVCTVKHKYWCSVGFVGAAVELKTT
mmetsp:Transcript_45029/g.119406  ORF Transcript_45029/g.119406 Transcript_45029/m.119406 type:complete len:94 (+) Transcript_45029:2171-2452(+)